MDVAGQPRVPSTTSIGINIITHADSNKKRRVKRLKSFIKHVILGNHNKTNQTLIIQCEALKAFDPGYSTSLFIKTRVSCHLFLVLLVLAKKGVVGTAETQAAQNLVQTQTAEEAVDNAAQAKTAEEPANKAEDTGKQEADGSENLAKRLHEKAPERVELLLGVRHTLDLALAVINGLLDGAGEL
jgi:hypothetical protein